MKRKEERARILALVREIPIGRVASYGDIARAAGMPQGARQVGWALSSLATADDGERERTPWWRVVNREGRFSLGGEGAAEQARRLEAERIAVSESGVKDFKRLRWDGGA